MFEDHQLSLFVISCLLLVFSTVVIVFRCMARSSIKGFGWDDWLMFAAQVRNGCKEETIEFF
jgi:competence protein ComGF